LLGYLKREEEGVRKGNDSDSRENNRRPVKDEIISDQLKGDRGVKKVTAAAA